MTEVRTAVNSGLGTEIRKGSIGGSKNVLYVNLGGNYMGVFICHKPLRCILKISVAVHLGCVIKHPYTQWSINSQNVLPTVVGSGSPSSG